MRLLRILIMLLFAQTAWAIGPEEMLGDPALEARAREISAGLRCPICQSESIDESNAAVARDLRLLVRRRLLAGDSDEEVVNHIVDRFGEYVLLEPSKDGANLLLWLSAPVILLIGLIIAWRTVHRGGNRPEELSDDERAELERILHGG